ncbi:hypothetical protein SAMD00023353_3000040 [Rosellinia necatrix]|uniref:Uncharacterized protein n=1 Tax=Rosellinia necatrix TaxID=77044 RepID=A0A1S8A9K2_ROSNE|nr:hypothetical protein SAMD00023353_3000040 [Rosellinia necatrix]
MSEVLLRLAAKDGEPNVVSLILSRLESIPSNINEKNAQDETGRTALHVASENNKLEVVARLLGDSVNIDVPDQQRRTPLHLTPASRRNNSVVKLLLKAYASRKARDHFMKTPLHLACAKGHSDIVKTPLEVGQETQDWLDNEKKSAMFYAIQGHYQDLAKTMKDKGVSIDGNNNNQSLLWQMASSGNVESCKIFIKLDANIGL